jgi:hypothetical protein
MFPKEDLSGHRSHECRDPHDGRNDQESSEPPGLQSTSDTSSGSGDQAIF